MEIELNLLLTLSNSLEVTNVRINSSKAIVKEASKTIEVKTPKKSKSKKSQDVIVLEDNKLILTQKLLQP